VLQPIKRIEGHVKLPGSKSLSNRILLLAALSAGVTEVQNLLVSDCYVQSSKKEWLSSLSPSRPVQDSEDIRLMVGALKDLGIKLEEDWQNDKITVHGCAGRFPVEDAKLYLGNAGTAMR
jgi:3-phosphoshikimate 1-carboxyvinyltransferase